MNVDTEIWRPSIRDTRARRASILPCWLAMPSDGDSAMSDPVREAICAAVAALLEPLASLAMEHQIFAPSFVELVDKAFVRAVEQEAERLGQPPPDLSKLAARTGLYRGRARKTRDCKTDLTSPTATRLPQVLRVLEAWRTDPDLEDANGERKTLSRHGRGPTSFTALVRNHVTDVRPAAILHELIRMKAVGLNEEGRLELLNRADIDAERRAQLVRDLGEFGKEYLESLVFSIMHLDTPRYFRRVVGVQLNNDEVPRLVREAAFQMGVCASGIQQTMMDKKVIVKPGSTPQEATRLAGHFLISERPTVVPSANQAISERQSAAKDKTQEMSDRLAHGSATRKQSHVDRKARSPRQTRTRSK